MGNQSSKYSQVSNQSLSLNADRGEAWWQVERGIRYGNTRQGKSKQKIAERKKSRRSWKNQDLNFINHMPDKPTEKNISGEV